MNDDVIVLEPGDERAQKIARAMASPTAADVLTALKNGDHTSSEIAEALAIPMTTVTYHIGNLLEAGMIDIVKTRWSRKGREVKIYGLRDQLVIVSPRTTDVRAILVKYAGLFSIFVVATLMMAIVAPLLFPVPAMEDGAIYAQSSPEPSVAMDEKAVRSAGSGVVPDGHDSVIAFFTGGCAILVLLILYELILWYRDTRQNAPRKKS
ncbi:MAG: helix-turn-helix transcriptional regulator [Methanomicrobiaceae archaeon]|nr:helix-turn-helix transcriptional regulator [Methanomicrobiaceae archaeon]